MAIRVEDTKNTGTETKLVSVPFSFLFVRACRRAPGGIIGQALLRFTYSSSINYLLYQAGWFACILGAANGWPHAGFAIAVALTIAHLIMDADREQDYAAIGVAIAVGIIAECYQVSAGTYRIDAGVLREGWPPPWLIAMWAQFATVFRFSMRGIMRRWWSAGLLGAMGGPLAFLAGERLGAVTLLPPVATGLVRLSIIWAIALVVLSSVRRLEPSDPTSSSGVGPHSP
jgi:hypothetical protein